MTNSVLTIEQIRNLGEEWSCFFPEVGYEDDCIRDIEQAVLQSEQVQAWKKDAERYRYLIDKLQRGYDGDYFETDRMSLYCHMPSQHKGERIVRAEITWRDKTDEPIGLSEAIDHARHIEEE